MNIAINGKQHPIEKSTISYDEVLTQAYGKIPDPLITITYYWRGEGDNKRTGIISPGQTINIAEGMAISACYTGDA